MGKHHEFHPHIHAIVLGGGLDVKNHWKDNGKEFFLPIKVISKYFVENIWTELKQHTNWYFESIDKQLGSSTINSYLQQIGYGNENISGDFSSYWMQSSLKISPVEQVELLKNLYRNNFNLLLLIFMPSKIPSILPPLKMENLWKNRNRTSERAGYKWLVYRFYRKPK